MEGVKTKLETLFFILNLTQSFFKKHTHTKPKISKPFFLLTLYLLITTTLQNSRSKDSPLIEMKREEKKTTYLLLFLKEIF